LVLNGVIKNKNANNKKYLQPKINSMKKSIIRFAIAIIGIILFSCDKEGTPLTKKEMLTGKSWKIESKNINPSFSQGGFVISDISVLEPEEIKNYVYKFNDDGTLIITGQAGETIFETNWSFNANETELVINPGIVFNYPMVGDFSLTTLMIGSITTNQIVSINAYTYENVTYEVTVLFK
jgi:hypothetical protein